MSVLYVPQGRAREYSPLAVNHYSGCSHGCTYCYVPTIPPYKFLRPDPRATFHGHPHPRENLLRALETDVRRRPGTGQRVLLSFTTDPYQPLDAEIRLTREVIRILHAGGYAVQVLTKGGTRALYDLEMFTPADAFATTMTLLSDVHSRKWEPGAALPADRIRAIAAFHEAGIPTWVSLEPVLNPDSAIEIIQMTHAYVDLYKIGKLNHHPLSERIDWTAFALRAVHLCESFDQSYYIKDDLAAFLPDGALGPYHVTAAEIERPVTAQSLLRSNDVSGAHRLQPQSPSLRTDLQPRLL